MKQILSNRVVLTTIGLVALGVAAIVLGAVLGDDSTTESVDPVEREDGSLAQDPAPLSLEDVSDQSAGSPAQTVIRFWYFGQWGGVEAAAEQYEPEVVDAVGEDVIRGAISGERGYLIATQPRVVDEAENADGTAFVAIEGYKKNAPPDRYDYTLVERGGEWLISFDTLLENGIAAYVQALNTPDPEADVVPPSAVQAGLDAARDFRDAGAEAASALERSALD